MRPFWTALAAAAAMTLLVFVAIGVAAVWLSVKAPPEKLMTAAFEIELADGWSCDRSGSEWFCGKGEPPHPAIAVIAMKYRSGEDNAAAFVRHLEQPQKIQGADGQELTSEVRYVRRRRIERYDWVDGLHYQSEVPWYFTHYIATVTSHVGILVTFSAHRDHYEDSKADLESMMQSLLVYQR